VAPWVQRTSIGHDLQFGLVSMRAEFREQSRCGSSGWHWWRWPREGTLTAPSTRYAHGVTMRLVQLLSEPSGEKLHPAVPVNQF